MKRFQKILSSLLVCFLALTATSCVYTRVKEIKYYSDERNYVEITGTIIHVVFDDENETLNLGFSDLSQKTDDISFKVVGDAYAIVAPYKEHIQIGKTATFISAPKCFGDGYVAPIVALSVDGLDILEYKDGFPSLLDWIKK